MKYTLKVSDNNRTDIYGPFDSHKDAIKERTSIIQAYGYNKSKGFTRETYEGSLYFKHAVYSTVVFTVEKA